ncbi:hypothetical protein ISN76_13225 [Dyella halodurans]|uniref:Uncharacterized protein n=1 Tax=Dyella halodurans TaxID=1920171 RepID=A0ABV9BZB7_9GAMM|nr:hypothetical protein [Dyella halodurans]
MLNSLPTGQIAFNTPATLNLQQTAHVQLLLDMKKTVEQLTSEIASPGTKQGASIKIAEQMEARLSGPQFEITAISPERQPIGTAETVEWAWDVVPTQSGQHPLHLTLSAIINVDGTPSERVMRTFDREINVEVTTMQRVTGFVTNNWQWLWAVVVAPVGAWGWKRWRRAPVTPGP